MHIFITGGAGFIGCNTAHHFLRQGHTVSLYDNLSRLGASANVSWLSGHHGDSLQIIQADIRDYDTLATAIRGADVILHLAGQVAVTTSAVSPRDDFNINALGTFNVLEAVRHQCPQATVLYASTNKVYGGMEDVAVIEQDTHYVFVDYPLGIPESYPLDFHSPYGCSKGAGDQYTRDYARVYGLKTLVLRQSCIYGPRQFGVEDQGWVAHFVIASVLNRPITIYGDGKQVRDLLHISDLIRAYELSIRRSEDLRGKILNLGGGPENCLSVWREFGPLLESLIGRSLPVRSAKWRPGDQRIFVADIRKAEALLGWKPIVSPDVGVRDLVDWVITNRTLFDTIY